MGRFTLTGRITIIIILVAILSTSVSGIMSLYIIKEQFASYVDVSNLGMVDEYSNLVRAYYKQFGSLEGLQANLLNVRPGGGNGHGYMMRSSGQGARIIVADAGGEVLVDTDKEFIGQKLDEEQLLTKGYSVSSSTGEKIGSIYIISPIKQGIQSLENTFLKNISTQIYISMIIVSLFALLLGLFLARGITSPLSELSTGIHGLARGNFKARVNPHGDRELHSLGTDFNLMAQKLMDTEESRRLLISNIAHELRTPLSILRGQLEAVQTGRLQITEEISTGLVDEVIRLTRLVSDLEKVGLAEGGALNLKKEKVAIEEIMDSLLPLRLAMEEERVEFIETIDDLIKELHVDRNRLIQILINLLSNAMRHAGQGGKIWLSISAKGDQVLFLVRDNGPGIAPADLERIFERFYRTDESRSRFAGGTGLGLAIARSYVEAHGGEIWAESELGAGTSFYFSLPT